ncbi:MAG: MBL fold metallo-hydrolase [Treponema sp.]|nr:MBL fold metallo-hydrolase [Candidatus Treponema equifaecale]
MKMTFMGTGTSHGIPVIGCSCPVCTSSDPRDNRLRCSVYVENCGNSEISGNGQSFETTNIVIDTGPEFRIQCLKHKIKRLDGVLLTHSHADHIYGLDDLRIFSYRKLEPAAMLACRQKNPAMSEHDAFRMNSMDYAVRKLKVRGFLSMRIQELLKESSSLFPMCSTKWLLAAESQN